MQSYKKRPNSRKSCNFSRLIIDLNIRILFYFFQLIQKELLEEDRRLDMMMEQARQKTIQAEEDKKKEKQMRNQTYLHLLRNKTKIPTQIYISF